MDCEEAHEGCDARVFPAPGFDYRLPESGWRRVLALWGFTGVPFFRAFRAPQPDGPEEGIESGKLLTGARYEARTGPCCLRTIRSPGAVRIRSGLKARSTVPNMKCCIE